jgi:hypothetical protein
VNFEGGNLPRKPSWEDYGKIAIIARIVWLFGLVVTRCIGDVLGVEWVSKQRLRPIEKLQDGDALFARLDEPPPQPIAPPDTPIDPGGGCGQEFGSLQALTIDVLKGVAKTCQSGIRVSKMKSAVAVT